MTDTESTAAVLAILLVATLVAFVFEFVRANANEDKVHDLAAENRDLRTSNAFLARRLGDLERPRSQTPIHDALVIDLFNVPDGLDEKSEEWRA